MDILGEIFDQFADHYAGEVDDQVLTRENFKKAINYYEKVRPNLKLKATFKDEPLRCTGLSIPFMIKDECEPGKFSASFRDYAKSKSEDPKK